VTFALGKGTSLKPEGNKHSVRSLQLL